MASRSVNKVILVGRLGKDAETKFTPSGVSVTKFSVATNWRSKDQQTGEWKEQTDWTNIVLWRGENVATYLTRGKQVYVEGRLQTRTYDDKDGKRQYYTEVVADEVILLGGRDGCRRAGPSDEEFGGMRSAPRSAARPAARSQRHHRRTRRWIRASATTTFRSRVRLLAACLQPGDPLFHCVCIVGLGRLGNVTLERLNGPRLVALLLQHQPHHVVRLRHLVIDVQVDGLFETVFGGLQLVHLVVGKCLVVVDGREF